MLTNNNNNSQGDSVAVDSNDHKIGRYHLRSRRPFGDANTGHPYFRQKKTVSPIDGQKTQETTAKNCYSYAKGDQKENVPPVRISALPSGEGKSNVNTIIRDLLLDKGIDIRDGKTVGFGRYSKVITAKLKNLDDHTVAIKIIDQSKVCKEFKKKFLPRELEIWRTILHPNLIELHAIYKYDEQIMLVSEYGQFGNLLNYVLATGPVAEQKGRNWCKQIISAVKYLHEKKIAHRDIKLENLIIFNENTIKLADFGFSREWNGIKPSETFCGSKSYTAPEVLSAIPYNPFISDIWSIGVVMFVMLTNSMPFSESMPDSEFVEHQRWRDYTWPVKLNLSVECTWTVDCLMTFATHKRPNAEMCLSLPWFRK